MSNGIRRWLWGRLARPLPPAATEAIRQHPGTRQIQGAAGNQPGWLADGAQVGLSPKLDVAINVQRVRDGAAVHILRYDYDSDRGEVPALDEACLELRLPDAFDRLEVFSLGEPPEVQMRRAGSLYTIQIKKLPLYSVLLLRKPG